VFELAVIVASQKTVKNILSRLCKVAMFFDFKTGLKFITWNGKGANLQEIRELLDFYLILSVYQHIPSHSGFHSNEKVDNLAAEIGKSISLLLAQQYSIKLRDAIRNRHPYRKSPPTLL